MFRGLPFIFSFIFLIIFGTLFSISSSHWLGIWAGLEINLIGFLPLLIYQKNVVERESAVKYFITQAIGSRLLILGSLIVYSMFFTWEVFSFSDFWGIGSAVIFSGIMLKIGVFPFYFWLPRVIAGLSWFSCLLLATWQKIAPLFLIALFLNSNSIYWLLVIISFFAAGSRLIGGFGGINQTQLRALVAYSSIGHLGWILFAVAHRWWAIKVYLRIYILISVCIFLSFWYRNLAALKNLNSSFRKKNEIINILVIFLSLGGLPPMLGFISKWVTVRVGMGSSTALFILLLILGSVISLFYYLSLLFSLFLSLRLIKPYKTFSKFNFILRIFFILNIFGGVLLILTDTLWSL